MIKVPYQVRTGKCAKVNEPAHFVPMTEAIEKVESYDGVGIRLSGSLAMMDIDHCREEDGWSLEAQEVLERFSGTYAEVSPSENGIHLYALVEEILSSILAPITYMQVRLKSIWRVRRIAFRR